MDRAEQTEREAELERLRETLGDDAFQAFEALAECRHGAVLEHARVAAQSDNKGHVLAGLWIETITFADNHQE